MARVYDNWDRLVRATLRREELRLSAERTPSEISSSPSSPSSSSDLIATSSSRASWLNFSSLLLLPLENYLSGSILTMSGRSGNLHHQNIHLGEGLQREVQFIMDELGGLTSILRAAKTAEDDVSDELREWISQVRAVAFDTEDVLEEFVMRFVRHRPDGFYGRVHMIYCSIKNMRARHQIFSTIKNIKSRLEDISARHQRYLSIYGLSERGSCSADVEDVASHIRGNALLLEEAELVGVAEPKRELISQILDGNSHLKVVSVVGMGGLGKTTLVKRVYEDANVKRQFQVHAWLTISQTFHMKVILKDLIQQLYNEIQEPVPQQVESMDGGNLRAFVKDFLQEKRYIIVLDDLWELESWETIKYAFPEANSGSRILLTTRISDTAKGSCRESNDYVYKMRPLPIEESWTLFCSKTFGDNGCPPHLEDVSRRILKKCKGLPLAIISIGGVLALKEKNKTDEWEMILRSLGSGMEGTGKLDGLKKILLLSYNDLPFFLKSCLLYISMYPEDFKIYAAELIRLWIVEGFILEIEGMTAREVAWGYLSELINRSLIQVAKLGHDGKVMRCHIHDILREIIITKSREQNLVTVAANGNYTRLPDNLRRLAIHGFIESQFEFNRFRHLRSLIIFGNTNPLFDSSLSEILNDGPKLLKVLNIRGAKIESIPKEVFKLLHLKCLNLRGTGVKIIPQSISKLQNLESLNLADTSVTELPIGILKVRKLRELSAFHIGNYSENHPVRGFKAPRKIGNLLSLEVLLFIEADNDEVIREIGKLTQLWVLGITKLRREDGKSLCSSLEKLTNLQKLYIISINDDEILDLQHNISPTSRFLQYLVLRGRLEKVPQWVPSLQSLTSIQLFGSGLREDLLESLQKLPNLVNVVLINAYEGQELCFKVGGFQRLKRLDLVKLQQLRWVRVEKNSLPSLKSLAMVECRLMDELPWGIQNLNKLQLLQLSDMGSDLIMKLQDKGSEEYQKIAQISEILISNWVNGENL